MYLDSILFDKHTSRTVIYQDHDILPEFIKFYNVEPPILDLTFGQGRFWKKQRPDSLIGIDLFAGVKKDGKLAAKGDVRADFRSLPFRNRKFGGIIYDPPHVKRNETPGHSVYNFYNTQSWDRTFSHALSEMWRCLRPDGTVIAKLANEKSRKGGWHIFTFKEEAEQQGFALFDLGMKLRGPSIRNPTQKQHRLRKCHSFFMILKKPGYKDLVGSPSLFDY